MPYSLPPIACPSTGDPFLASESQRIQQLVPPFGRSAFLVTFHDPVSWNPPSAGGMLGLSLRLQQFLTQEAKY